MKEYGEDDIVIVDSRRSIVGSRNGSLKSFGAAELASWVVNDLLSMIESKSKTFSRQMINQFVVGNCIGAGVGQNLPRQIARRCDITEIDSAFVVNEMCGSGLEAVALAVQSLKLNESGFVLAGGVETPSAAPFLVTQQQLLDLHDQKVSDVQEQFVRADVRDALWCVVHDVHTIVHAEQTTANYVKNHNLDGQQFKREIDEYTVESHKRALEKIQDNAFAQEITSIPGTSATDELPKNKNLNLLLKRRGTQYTPEGEFLTAHNSPPVANCAAFLLVTKYKNAQRHGLVPLAKVSEYQRAGVVMEDFLLAPIQAVKKLLEKSNSNIEDYDLLELNTAFGSQMLFNQKEFALDMSKVNVCGDCLAFGHPIAASGPRLITTLLHSMQREKKDRGLVSLCLGGGNGLAMSFETIS